MEKFRINILENRVIEIAVDDWLIIKGQHWLYPTLCDRYNDFYDIYLDEEDYESRNFIGRMQFIKESDCYISKRKK